MVLKNGKAIVNGKEYAVDVTDGLPAAAAPAAAASAAGAGGETIAAPVPGIVLRLSVANGAAVQADDELLVIEAMKMEIPIKASVGGTVTLHVSPADRVNTGDTLASVS